MEKNSFNKKAYKPAKKKGDAGGAVVTVIVVALITAAVGIYLLVTYGDKIPSYLIPENIFKPKTKTINLYFSDEEGLALKAETGKIAKGDLKKELSESMQSLIQGSKGALSGTIPEGTRFLDVEVRGGVAFLNFSKEISENHPGGSSAELQTIYSIVNTITLNFPAVKKVQFLIEGKKMKTLAGHIDISFPLGPDKDLIKG